MHIVFYTFVQHSAFSFTLVHCPFRHTTEKRRFFSFFRSRFCFIWVSFVFYSYRSYSLTLILSRFKQHLRFWCVWHHKNGNINQLTFNQFSFGHWIPMWISSKSPSLCAFIKICNSLSQWVSLLLLVFLVLLIFPLRCFERQKKNIRFFMKR